LNVTTYFFDLLDDPIPNIFTLVLYSLSLTSQSRSYPHRGRMGKGWWSACSREA
jgi:hypothetical protein